MKTKFTAAVRGKPEPVVRWYKDSIEIMDDGYKYRMSNVEGNLIALVLLISCFLAFLVKIIVSMVGRSQSSHVTKIPFANVQHFPSASVQLYVISIPAMPQSLALIVAKS